MTNYTDRYIIKDMDNRQRLMDCALDLFSQRGYDAVGVREIVEAAGVTKPTLYHYFNSKRGLLEAVLKREAPKLIEEVLKSAVYQGDLVLTLENITRVYFQTAQRFTAFYRMQLAMYFSPPESEANQAIHLYARQQHQILEDIFIEAVADHGNLRHRHQHYAAIFLGGINAMIGLYLNDGLDLSNELIFKFVHQFMYGIFS